MEQMDIRDKVNHAYDQRQYINYYISLSDTKMAIFVALNTALIGKIISDFQYNSGILQIIMQIISLVLLSMAIILSFSVLIPRTYNVDKKTDIDDAKHIYNINNNKIQWCSVLSIFLKETKNLIKAICLVKDKPDKQSINIYPNFIISWVDMYQSHEITSAIPDDMSEEELLKRLNELNNILAGICATKNALAKISIILSIYAYLLILMYNIIINVMLILFHQFPY